MASDDQTFVNTEDCPRCSCWMARKFECNCGAIHANCCLNCGRYTAPSLSRDQYVSEEDKQFCAPCTAGPVEHAHDAEERAQKVEEFFAEMTAAPPRASKPAEPFYGGGVFACLECNQEFSDPGAWAEHLRRVHAE